MDDWTEFYKAQWRLDAEPNAPEPMVTVTGSTLCLRFQLNHMAYSADEVEGEQLTFTDCRTWAQGATNDEGGIAAAGWRRHGVNFTN